MYLEKHMTLYVKRNNMYILFNTFVCRIPPPNQVRR